MSGQFLLANYFNKRQPEKRKPGIVIFILLIVLLLHADSSSENMKPVEIHGKLHVAGTRIVDKQGAPVQLKGMSLFWSQWGYQFWNKDVLEWLRQDWAVDVVRAPVGIEEKGYLIAPQMHREMAEVIVDAAIKSGIYIIIDWHDHNAWKNPNADSAVSFFKYMANKYKSYPNVIYEIYNEPVNVSWSTIKKYSQRVIMAIRSEDPDNLIIAGTPNWCQRLDDAAQDPLNDANLLYSFHFYAATHSNLFETLRRNESKIPVFVSEWGTCEYTGNGRMDISESKRWLNFLEDKKIGWCNWSLMNKRETSSALDFGAMYDGGWNDSNLTPSGRFVRKYLKEHAVADTVNK